MRLRLAAGAALLALAGAAMPSSAASTLLLIPDPAGDANFSGLHGGAAPIPNQAGFDITAVTFDTVKKNKVVSAVKIDITMAAPPSTQVTSSYGIIATHSVCGAMRLQIYYTPTGPETYGDLAECGAGGTTSDSQFAITFSPKVDGNVLRFELPIKTLPKEFKVGSVLSDISAYTSNAEPLVAGYQPTDFEPTAGTDTAVAEKTWKVA